MSFATVSINIKYLGVNSIKNVQDFYITNYKILLTDIQQCLNAYLNVDHVYAIKDLMLLSRPFSPNANSTIFQ